MSSLQPRPFTKFLSFINYIILFIELLTIVIYILFFQCGIEIHITLTEKLRQIDFKTLLLFSISHLLFILSLRKNIKMGEVKINEKISITGLISIIFVFILFLLYVLTESDGISTDSNHKISIEKIDFSTFFEVISKIFLNISIFFFGNLFSLIGKERKNKQETKSKVINKKRKTETNETIEITYK